MQLSRPWALRIAGFLTVVAAVGGLSEILGLKYWMPRINDRSLNIYLYQKEKIEPDVLIFGTSKILRGLIPESVDSELSDGLGREVSTYTLGQMSASCFANALIMRDVLESNRPPKVVILEVSPGALSEHHYNVPDALRHYASIPDLIRATPWLCDRERMSGAASGYFRGFANIALYAHHTAFPHGLTAGLERLLMWRGRRYGITDDSPVRLSELSPKRRKRMAGNVARLSQRLHLDSYRIGGPPKAGFYRICRLARSLGIPLVVINPPVSDEYRRLTFSKAVADEYHRFMAEAERSEGFGFFDLDRGAPGLTDADFMDLGHLNSDGARKLSRYVARKILRPVMSDEK
jgi:hypothetical protein